MAFFELRFGGRRAITVVQSVFRRRHWIALANMWRLYPDFLQNLYRYLTARGNYPYVCRIRTPVGLVSATLYSHHDLLTVNEIFCREDYKSGDHIRTVVDIGSNIGISALYFLTRNHVSKVILYEPVPANAARLKQNLAGYEDRYVLHGAAVFDQSGSVQFGVEDTGRYGGIDLASPACITVECRHIDEVLAPVLELYETIDIVKLDIEGGEVRTVAAVSRDLLRRVHQVFVETTESIPLEGFSAEQYGMVWRYTNVTFCDPPAGFRSTASRLVAK